MLCDSGVQNHCMQSLHTFPMTQIPWYWTLDKNSVFSMVGQKRGKLSTTSKLYQTTCADKISEPTQEIHKTHHTINPLTPKI